MSPDTMIWGVIGVQVAISITTLGAFYKLIGILEDARKMIGSVDQRLSEDSKEHVKIIEKLATLDEDVRELRRER